MLNMLKLSRKWSIQWRLKMVSINYLSPNDGNNFVLTFYVLGTTLIVLNPIHVQIKSLLYKMCVSTSIFGLGPV